MSGSNERIGIAAAVVRGLGAGCAAGAVWWLVEFAVNYGFGGVLPLRQALIVLALDLGIAGVGGLVVGAVLGALGRGGDVAGYALGITIVYGLLRVYEPPGLLGEAMFVVVGTLAAVVGVLLAGPRRGALGFVHVALVATAALAIGKTGITEVQSSYFSKQEPNGVALVLVLAALPLAGVAADRLVGLVVRRDAVRLATWVVAALVAGGLWGKPLSIAPLDDPRPLRAVAPVGAPDVFLISMDTTRADHMSTYGYARETSPHLTALAADALNFTQARSPAQWTVPGHASMLTGMYPSRHGAHYVGGWSAGPAIYGRRRVFPLADDRTTLAEALHDRGWATGAFVANFANLFRGFGMAQGFQRYEDHPELLLRPIPHVVGFLQQFSPAFMKKPFRSAEAINAAALAWLDEVPAGRPAFVFLNYLEPHHWIAAPPYDLWARDLPHAARLARKGLFTHAVPANLSGEERDFVAANYDGQILAMDAALGALVAELKKRGRYENALIVVTADHGELLGEHDIVGHGGRMMYEGLLRIPMVVKLPGPARPKGVVADPVQLVDILPTVLQTIGAPLPGGVQGSPLQRVAHDSLAEEHINPEFVSFYGEVYNRALRVIYEGPYKLISTSRGERFLFDLGRDPGEDENLAAREPERVSGMEDELEAAMSAMDSNVAAAVDPYADLREDVE
ncbi:MAG: sulfatase [Deltaproteobacteria bacterium]|nr:sulfatase [Deltaproteobacteria bacterium]